jgi:hypothetical protein
MKLLKFIFVLFVTVSFTSCSDDETDATPFVLSNANISGAYNISSINFDTKVTSITDVLGVPVPFTVATSKSIGDTFNFEFVLKADGTYTASGLYRIVSVITPAAGDEVTNSEIISITDSGTFTLNTIDAQITFFSALDDFLSGTFNILIFNETVLSLNQEIEEVDDAITTEINASIRFIRE